MKIESIKDPRIIYARQLAYSKGRLEHDAFLLEGKEQIEWALDAQLAVKMLFIHEKIIETELCKRLEKYSIPYFFVSEGILKKITDTKYLVPLVGVAKKPKKKSRDKDFMVVLDNVVDFGNIGAIVRSAAAFGIKNIIGSRTDADFFYKKIIDASRGKIFTMDIEKFPDDLQTIHYLKSEGYQIVATSPHAKQVQSLVQLSNKPVALVVGNETYGCSQAFIDQADVVLQIPMNSAVESLNVAVAAGISIYELKIKLVIVMLIEKIYKNLGRQFSVTLQLIQQAFDANLSKVSELSAMHIILLMIVKCDEFMSIAQVVKDVGEHQEGLEQLLEPLFAEEFIVKATRENIEGILLTKRGEEFLAKMWPVVEKTEEQLLTNFSELEKAQLVEYLSRIQDNCYNIISEK